MKTKFALITGASKGIGKELALTYSKLGWKVVVISRTKGDLPLSIKQLQADLSNTDSLKNAFKLAFAEVEITTINRFTLINNAGRLGEIANIENISEDDVSKSIQLNLSAVIQLSSLFIEKLKNIKAVKKIINISSGAASYPYSGWSVYCASKAGVDMFTKTVALEQQKVKNPVSCIAIRPGIVETDMQRQIRKTSKKDFISVDKFIDLYKSNSLSNPNDVANKIYQTDINDVINSGEIVDLRNL
jgi:benzil reductase ((S)-benzoin forming)